MSLQVANLTQKLASSSLQSSLDQLQKELTVSKPNMQLCCVVFAEIDARTSNSALYEEGKRVLSCIAQVDIDHIIDKRLFSGIWRFVKRTVGGHVPALRF